MFAVLHFRKGLVDGVHQSTPLLIVRRAAEALRMQGVGKVVVTWLV